MSDQSNITLDFLGRTLVEIQVEQRRQRTDLNEMRSLILAQIDYSRRIERRLSEMRDDLELMFKSELMGRLTNSENRVDVAVDELGERVAALENKT